MMEETISIWVVLLLCEGFVRGWRRIGLMLVNSTWREESGRAELMERRIGGSSLKIYFRS